jgi:N-acetylglutamate synthase-like GNAT family acetyltransferase
MTETYATARDSDQRSLDSDLLVRAGTSCDIPPIKVIADHAKSALGFVHRASLTRAVARDELIVADVRESVAGFCHFYRRKDGIITLYHIAVDAELRRKGIGRAMIVRLHRDATESGMVAIRLKCPADLPANEFYARYGFSLVGVEGKIARPLHVWTLGLG